MGMFRVVLKKGDDGLFVFTFPDERDRLNGCKKLAEMAEEERGWFGNTKDYGHFRDLFLGSTGWRLMEIIIDPNMTPCFHFLNNQFERPVEEYVTLTPDRIEMVTRRKESTEIIIKI